MKISPYIQANFKNRYKRFFCDFYVDEKIVTAHCMNTGSMAGLLEENAPSILSIKDPHKKLKYGFELIQIDGQWKGTNTINANRIVKEAINSGFFAHLDIQSLLSCEYKISDKSKADFLCADSHGNEIIIEVKNCTLQEDCVGLFPDSITLRGQKHLHELMELKRQGKRAILLFCVQLPNVSVFKPAEHIDCEYGRLIRRAVADYKLEVYAYKYHVQFHHNHIDISLNQEIPVDLS